MKFNMAQQQQIYEFIMKYNSDESFKDKVEELYFENPGMLSILEIYALEEIIQFGNNGIYNSLLELQENNVEETTEDNLEENTINADENTSNATVESDEADGHYDVILQVKPEKVSQIKSQIIDGKKCIIIPINEDEHTTVNGLDDLI